MFNFLEKLRAKPERVKKQMAFLISFLIVGIIFVVWLSVIYPDFRQNQLTEQKVKNFEPNPASSFSATFSSGISAIKEQFNKIKESISSFSTKPAYYSASTTVGTSTNSSQ